MKLNSLPTLQNIPEHIHLFSTSLGILLQCFHQSNACKVIIGPLHNNCNSSDWMDQQTAISGCQAPSVLQLLLSYQENPSSNEFFYQYKTFFFLTVQSRHFNIAPAQSSKFVALKAKGKRSGIGAGRQSPFKTQHRNTHVFIVFNQLEQGDQLLKNSKQNTKQQMKSCILVCSFP